MRRLLGLVLLLWPAASMAEVNVLASAGKWQAFSAPAGRLSVCGLRSQDGSAGFTLAYIPGTWDFEILVTDARWPPDAARGASVVVHLLPHGPWRAPGEAYPLPSGAAAVRVAVDANSLEPFVDQFRNSTEMQVRLEPGGHAWRAETSGTEAVGAAFVDCLRGAR